MSAAAGADVPVAPARRVYSVANVNRGLARRIDDLPALWVEGEIGDLRYHANRGVTFLTLRDPDEGATLLVTMAAGSSSASIRDRSRASACRCTARSRSTTSVRS